MKFLVLGATGMAGHTISLYLHEQGHDVTTFSKSTFPYCKNIIGDATDQTFMLKTLKEKDYDVVSRYFINRKTMLPSFSPYHSVQSEITFMPFFLQYLLILSKGIA